MSANKNTYSVCAECVMFAANGPEDSMSAERVRELGRAHEGYLVFPVRDECGETCEPSFAYGHCSVCHSSMGGDYYECEIRVTSS